MKNIKHLLKNAGKRNVIIFVLVQIVSSCVVAGVALLLSSLLNTVSEVIISGDIARLLTFIGLCCIYAIATGILLMLQGYVRARLVRDTVIKMRNSAVKAYLRRNDAVNMNENSAEFFSLLSQNMDTIEIDWLGGCICFVLRNYYCKPLTFVYKSNSGSYFDTCYGNSNNHSRSIYKTTYSLPRRDRKKYGVV